MVTITKKELKRVWNGLKRVVAKRLTVPVLNHVLMRSSSGNCCTLEGNDLEQYLVANVEAETTGEEQTFLVPVDELKELAKGRGGQTVGIEAVDGTSLRVDTPAGDQRLERSVSTLPVAEWPEPLGEIAANPTDLAGLLAAYRRVACAVANNEVFYALNGVHLDAEAQAVVATDGRRLMRVVVPEAALPCDAIVPVTRFLDSDVLAGADGRLGLACEDGWNVFRVVTENWDYRVRTIDEDFPNYRQVIPALDGYHTSIDIAEEDLATVESACRQFPDDDEHSVALYADAENVVMAHVEEAGEEARRSHVRLPNSTARTEGPVAVFLNREFLIDGLTAGFRTVHLGSQDKVAPLRLTGDNDGDTCVMMPLSGCVVEPLMEHIGERLGCDR